MAHVSSRVSSHVLVPRDARRGASLDVDLIIIIIDDASRVASDVVRVRRAATRRETRV